MNTICIIKVSLFEVVLEQVDCLRSYKDLKTFVQEIFEFY